MKREYLISYQYYSKKYGQGYGSYTIELHRKLKADDKCILKEKAINSIREYNKDNNEYFDVVIMNICKL